MNDKDSGAILLDTLDRCLAQLPPKIAGNLTHPQSDPSPLKKKQNDIVRIRVLPRKKSPVSFWNSTWCFYQLGLGVYGGALTVGGVSFVQFPFQDKTGDGHYCRSVIEIIQRLGAGKGSSFQLTPASGPGTATSYKRLYGNRDFPFFPVEQAANDLSWLIANTLPAFEAIS
jgi:hypothetical protein